MRRLFPLSYAYADVGYRSKFHMHTALPPTTSCFQGDKLADILRAEGFNFKAMEVKVKQLVVDEEVNRTSGGWHTEISLKALNWTTESPDLSWLHAFTTWTVFSFQFVEHPIHEPSIARSMISNAKSWAQSRNLCRRNEVHGADEFKVPTESSYEFTNTRRREAEGEGSFQVEDPDGQLLNFSDLSEDQAILLLSFAQRSWKVQQ